MIRTLGTFYISNTFTDITTKHKVILICINSFTLFIFSLLQVQIPNNIFSLRLENLEQLRDFVFLECFEYPLLIHCVNKNNINGLCGPTV